MIKATITCEATPIKLLTQLTARPEIELAQEVMFADSSLVISSNWGLISEETRLSRKSSMVALAFPNKLASYERNSPLVVGRMESLQLDPKLKALQSRKRLRKSQNPLESFSFKKVNNRVEQVIEQTRDNNRSMTAPANSKIGIKIKVILLKTKRFKPNSKVTKNTVMALLSKTI